MKSYSYPMEDYWTRQEMLDVIALFNAVEAAYEEGIPANEFQEKYNNFKKVVQTISEEKRLGREFERLSGYSIYLTVKEMKRLMESQKSQQRIHLK